MRIKTFLLANLIFLFLLPSISYAVSISCDPCTVSNCRCTITDCSDGTLDVYTTSDCTLIPTYSFSFTDGTITWTPASANNYYLKVLCDDGEISDCTEVHLIGIPPTTTPGGGGGGGGGGGPPINKTHGKTQYWVKITSGAAAIMKITNPEIGLKQINITVNNPAQAVKITVTKLDGKPATVVHEIVGKVYKYIEIDAVNINEAHINKVKIKFEVNKSWITDNNIDPDTVALYRYTNVWEELSTIKTSEDNDFVYYESETPGFSTFAISGDVEAETTITTVPITTTICISTGNSCASDSDCCSGYCCDNICSDTECEVDKGFRTYFIILIVIVVSVSAIALFYTKYWKRPVPEEVEGSVYTRISKSK